jgi:pescadillo
VRKNALVPTYTIHHLVKERYPRFVDALSDMDDALTLSYLFAALPSDRDIKSKVVNKAKKVVAAWGAYCSTTSAIQKSFISVKGVYLEASIQNVAVRWIVPHSFTQYLPEDVDFRIMMTFFEFYETLLNFVLFKLYSNIGVRYPFPLKELGGEAVGSTSAILSANLRALTNTLNSSNGAISKVVTEGVQKDSSASNVTSKGTGATKNDKKLIESVGAALNKLTSENSDEDDVDDDDESVDVAGPLQAALDNMTEEQARNSIPGGDDAIGDESLKRKCLFAGLTFFLSREIPRGYLELVCLSYGGKVGWEGEDSPVSTKDSSITHNIVDRPKLPASYDSLPKSREYVQPQWIVDSANFMFLLPISRYAVGATLPPHLSPWVDDEEEGYKPAYADEIERLKNGETVDMDAAPGNADTDGEEEVIDVDDHIDKEEAVEEEEEMEEEEDSEKARKRLEKKRKIEEDEAQQLARTMMSRKATHLYGRMQRGIAQKQAKVETLQQRRKEIDTKEKDSSGKTPLKQKVERLKMERKTIEGEYSKSGGTMTRAKKSRKN